MDFVSWDDDIPNCFWKVIQNSVVPNHQAVVIYSYNDKGTYILIL